MGAYSLAEAALQLDRLVEAALKGETVTLTRDGHALVALTPPRSARSPLDAEDLEEMLKRALLRPSRDGDAVTLVREMRDEER
jgi:antitoxin (DNA-binding transcriptional repressor) of toxin-antitoxin stability system